MLKSNRNIHTIEFTNFNDIDKSITLNKPFLSVSVTDNGLNNIQDDFAILTYSRRYPVHSVIKLKREVCKDSVTIGRVSNSSTF